jgi:hypothetical protein
MTVAFSSRRKFLALVFWVLATQLNIGGQLCPTAGARGNWRPYRERGHLLRLRTAGFDAVDGSSTGTRVPRKWELLKLP